MDTARMHRTKLFCLLALALGCSISSAREYEGTRANSILLNGAWEFARGDGAEDAETATGAQKLSWRPVTLPGPFMPWSREAANETKVIWARRSFKATGAQAQGLAVLRWNRIACGATAFINGQKVGANEPTGPYQVIVPAGILKPGDNQIVLKIRGAAGVPRSRSGNALIPAGFGVGMPEVTDDVWLDFADAAYMKWVLALPDLAGSRVQIRVTPTGPERLEDLQIVAQVKSWPDGKIVGEGHASARLVPSLDPLGGEHFFVEVPMPGFQPWTYETPNLYTAEVVLRRGEKVLDEVTIRFGMREITIAGGHYLLNGKTLRLRGSELVFEWNWGDTITGKEFDYLVTEAREMSMNAFRTHTMPPPPLWTNICDENGTMILAEFPCLYNYQDYKFTPEEYAIWHRNVLSDAAGWMGRLWNHPAVVMWVLSNESNRDGEWEKGPYHDFVRALDPTRPTMRTGDTGTAENYDVHTCGNVEDTLEGNLIPRIGSWFRAAEGRPVTNSEYMNYFGRPAAQWTGKEDKEADALACAQIGMEHTEAMRRARVDGMLPYMYAGWTRTRLAARVKETGQGSAVWKAGYATPLSACWHSALSPVLASLDLFDPTYLPGQEVRTDLYLINDSWHDATIHVDLLLTEESPEFIPEAACLDRPVERWSYDFTLKADTLTKTPITWKLPQREGSYWLTARTTGIAGRPVLSQRFVRAVRPPEVPAVLRDRRFVVLGGDAAADAWFRSRGLQMGHGRDGLTPEKQVVVIWNAAHLTADEKRQAGVLREFVSRGGRMVVLAMRSWDWTELCDIKVGDTRGSRAFPYTDAKPSMLAGLRPEWLMRWNGLPGTVAVGSLDGPALTGAERILWVREPKTCVAAEVPTAGGTGRILFSQLDVHRHVDRTKPGYDPVAERILINLLQEPQVREKTGEDVSVSDRQQEAPPVPLWGRFEATVAGTREYANPFTDVELRATFIRPDQSRVSFWGFHDGDGHGDQTGNIWKLRFMPDQVGTWSYECSFSDGTPGQSGTFDCVRRGARPGPLRVDPVNPHGWTLADGSRFFARAYTAPELFVAGNHTHRTYWIDYFFGTKHRFNFCNANLLNFVGVGAELNWQGTPYQAPNPARDGQYVTISGNGLFPFLYSGTRPKLDGGSNVDWLRPSVRCWANVDGILAELEARQVVWFNHWGMIGWDWSGNGRLLVPASARKAVLRYWMARLAPYWNVTWNIAGEWDELLSPAEFDELGAFIKDNDPWKHPVTSHALGTTVDRPWVDFRVEQFSAGTSSDSVTNANRAAADYADKPVFAFETSWEATPGKLTPDQVRTGAWGSLMGGAFYLYAECFEPTLTWGDGRAFGFIEVMNDFLSGLAYWKLKPDHGLVNSGSLCLADPGREYVVYRQAGGTIIIDLPGTVSALQAEWLDPRTGARKAAAVAEGGAQRMFSCPDPRDWVLHLYREE